jgi:hypothetical protein
MNDDQKPMNLYILHTTAPYESVGQLATFIAHAGYIAMIAEAPPDTLVIVQPRIWGPARWWAVFVALSGAPFLFHVWPAATGLQGFGIGWIAAAIILLSRRVSGWAK